MSREGEMMELFDIYDLSEGLHKDDNGPFFDLIKVLISNSRANEWALVGGLAIQYWIKMSNGWKIKHRNFPAMHIATTDSSCVSATILNSLWVWEKTPLKLTLLDRKSLKKLVVHQCEYPPDRYLFRIPFGNLSLLVASPEWLLAQSLNNAGFILIGERSEIVWEDWIAIKYLFETANWKAIPEIWNVRYAKESGYDDWHLVWRHCNQKFTVEPSIEKPMARNCMNLLHWLTYSIPKTIRFRK